MRIDAGSYTRLQLPGDHAAVIKPKERSGRMFPKARNDKPPVKLYELLDPFPVPHLNLKFVNRANPDRYRYTLSGRYVVQRAYIRRSNFFPPTR